MISRITSAYGYFSKLRQKYSQPGSGETEVSRNALEHTAHSSSRGAMQEIREKQVQQLRETGTLDNLQVILDESEKALLRKLFPDRS
ncbi:MAG TPA: hypothetical protein VKA68_17990, partial [bacterium]|nr:hypothetical protein [bacterium]